ncbi:proline dehydrogenase family protein [soil metagenome]
MEFDPLVRFEDTATAFSYKTNKELWRAHFVFRVVNNPIISKISTSAVKLAMSLRLPVKSIIKATVFEHFCGGETIEETNQTVLHLGEFNVKTILDYSVEGEKTEDGFDLVTEEVLRTFTTASQSSNIPFCVFKVTGLADSALLEKIQTGEGLSTEEISDFEKVKTRVDRICSKAFALRIPVLIDAEETWIQDPIDALAYNMMRKYNKEQPIIFNTYQLYRADISAKLKEALETSIRNDYFLGVKLVRGAYMEKEAARAERMGYPDPIQPSKEATDEAFNHALKLCIENISKVSMVCGSHNEYSNQYLTVLMKDTNISPSDNRVWFAQLLGMSDNISFNLAKVGFNVAKYVPYGPVDSVMPYLLRRAAENTSVAGQSSRELSLIRREVARRKSNKG